MAASLVFCFLKAGLFFFFLLWKINTVIASCVWGVMMCCSIVLSLGVIGCCPVLCPGATLLPGLRVHPRGPILADIHPLQLPEGRLPQPCQNTAMAKGGLRPLLSGIRWGSSSAAFSWVTSDIHGSVEEQNKVHKAAGSQGKAIFW